MAKTENIGLNLTEDEGTSFSNWRRSIDGKGTGTAKSNMQLIDAAVGSLQKAQKTLNIESGSGTGSLQQKNDEVKASGENSMALGGTAENHPTVKTQADGDKAFAAGASAQAKGYASAAFNRKTQALQYGCFAAGGGNRAGRTQAEFNSWVKYYTDQGTTVGTVTQYAVGGRTYCYDSSVEYEKQYYVLFEGYGDTHYDYNRFETYAASFGESNQALGRSSFTIGKENIAVGLAAFAGGWSCEARNDFSVALNHDCIAGANNAMAVNHKTSATGENSFAANSGGAASGTSSAKFGTGGVASGRNAFTIGQNCKSSAAETFAGGNASNAESWMTFVYGQWLKASAQCQTVFGRYNAISTVSSGEDWELFQIGNGWGDAANQRRNAFGVRYDGTAYVYSAPKRDEDVVRLQEILLTDDDIEAMFA